MKIYVLGDEDNPCFLIKIKTICILLDCGLDMDSILSFFPVKGYNNDDYQPSFKKRKFDEDSDPQKDIFVDFGNYVFINDSDIKFHLPQFNMIDIADIDVILISNYHNLMALPYLTEYLGFTGSIFATEPVIQIGRLRMNELVTYVRNVRAQDSSHSHGKVSKWQTNHIYGNLSKDMQKMFPDALQWRDIYSYHDVENCLSKITCVSYDEIIDTFDSVFLIPSNSGNTIGGVNWVIKTQYEKIGYISKSSLQASRYCKNFNYENLQNCSALLFSDLNTEPFVSDNKIIEEICTQIGKTVKNGGNVLIPTHPNGAMLDLVECLMEYFGGINMTNVPIYVISPMFESFLAYTNIIPEWLSDDRQNKSYLPEFPFAHKHFIESGFLKVLPNLNDGRSTIHEPCVVFTGHPSIRFGDTVTLLNNWKGNPKNTLIMIDENYDVLKALRIHEPVSMEIRKIYFDSRLNINTHDLPSLIQKCDARTAIVPQSCAGTLQNSVMSTDIKSYNHLDTISISLRRKYEKCKITSKLSQSIIPLQFGSKQVSVLRCNILLKDGVYIMENYTGTDSNTEEPKLPLWGSPNFNLLLKEFEKLELGDIQVDLDELNKVKTIKFPSSDAEVIILLTETLITAKDNNLRKKLFDIVAENLTLKNC
eukprot:TRINITY_DN13248_c0_g1_i1.p1 TRINITY_DN13248_c0_g1~~TRINITY_DN13248_c0_g1_i1.p1  ORF type:complete len:648 (+),score=125.18 TRINITY_DN13248_c0_g1_i1:143-2086(+)